jgi:predicted ABC-type ATPase
MLKGGHTVPAEKIKSRYSKSIDNCSKVINLVDRAYIYDNSENSELLFRTVKNNGKHGMKTVSKIKFCWFLIRL